ncbi:hypothetical protein EI555_007992 [Monodon monoceros]|uniref:SB domain-containing protein n=1 Tax=Monodon monoceros TaxID=40151 RepID=A0A4U1EU35_MONMO|nr:hypothetical protein EI555_007992 [Monodon monoceros]
MAGSESQLKKMVSKTTRTTNLYYPYVNNITGPSRDGTISEDTIRASLISAAEVDKNIELLRKKDEELSSALEKMENQSENNDIDEVIIPTAPLYKQILNLYAEENAIEDTIFYLGEALRRGVIDLDVFLKHVRLLSRKQFQLRALMQKARKTAGLSDLY